MADGTLDARAQRAATSISHAEEKRIALSLSPRSPGRRTSWRWAENSRIEGLLVGPKRRTIGA